MKKIKNETVEKMGYSIWEETYKDFYGKQETYYELHNSDDDEVGEVHIHPIKKDGEIRYNIPEAITELERLARLYNS